MSFNRHGIWIGERETVAYPFGKHWHQRASIEIARTPRGFEFATHHGCGGYGIGFYEKRLHATRDDALRAGIAELRERIPKTHDELNGKESVPALLRWLDGLEGEIVQPDLFGEAHLAA